LTLIPPYLLPENPSCYFFSGEKMLSFRSSSLASIVFIPAREEYFPSMCIFPPRLQFFKRLLYYLRSREIFPRSLPPFDSSLAIRPDHFSVPNLAAALSMRPLRGRDGEISPGTESVPRTTLIRTLRPVLCGIYPMDLLGIIVACRFFCTIESQNPIFSFFLAPELSMPAVPAKALHFSDCTGWQIPPFNFFVDLSTTPDRDTCLSPSVLFSVFAHDTVHWFSPHL